MTATNAPLMHHDRFDPYGLVGSKMNTTDAAEALRLADLDWEVTMEPAAGIVDGLPMVKKGSFATVRRNPDTTASVLGFTGNRFTPFQNRATVDLMQLLVDSSNATFTAGGHTHGATRTFMQMALPEGVVIGGRDAMGMSAVLLNNHVAKGSLILVPTATRLFCTNQFPGLKRSKIQFSARHTAGALEIGVAGIRKALELTFAYAKEVEQIGNVLVQKPMTTAEFETFVKQVHAPELDAKTHQETGHSVAWRRKLVVTFDQAMNLDNVRGTQWAALQTVIEGQDWLGRAKNPVTHAIRQVTRAPHAEAIKTRALSLLLPTAV